MSKYFFGSDTYRPDHYDDRDAEARLEAEREEEERELEERLKDLDDDELKELNKEVAADDERKGGAE
jgi:hypothetical protein